MKYQIKVSATAYQETGDAYEYYEEQSPGLGERFLKSLEDSYLKLSQTPQYYSYIRNDKNIRDIKIKTFPFVIIFQIMKNTVLVLRVFNTNRNHESLKNL
ncbi:MAG: type II toxin-antitoxin system RelE/ParE family toxin [Bacteroidota bacterium]|nr:type II toxin-antitoxin system RelE/ParE family toxin [Bacteroidota bacterium]